MWIEVDVTCRLQPGPESQEQVTSAPPSPGLHPVSK
jgi:hypothetical protein